MLTDEIEALWPPSSVAALTDHELATIYAYPCPRSSTRPWIRANFVTSLDGAVNVDGRSEGLSGAADKRVFRLLRALSDVILVGAGTVRVEGYGNTHLDVEPHASLRVALQLTPVPPIAVVTRFGDLDPAGALFTGNVVSPIVFTSHAAPRERLAALADAGADIVVTGDQFVPLTHVVEELGRRGLRRVLCEGGPQLFAGLVATGAVDELCLTLAPTLTVGGHAPRMSAGPVPETPAADMRLESALVGDDALLLRYRTAGRGTAGTVGAC